MREGSITKDEQRGTWTLTLDMGVVGGTRRQVRRRGFPTKKAAMAERHRLLTEASEGRWVEPDRRLFGDLLHRWIGRLHVEGLKPATISNYRTLVATYVDGHPVAEVPVQSLAADDLDDLYASLMDRDLSARTVRLVHSVIRRCLAEAVRKGVIARNPAELATPPSRKQARRKLLTVWTPDELRAVLDKVDPASGYHAAIVLMAGTGLRRSEALGLWWDDIDLDAGKLTVRRTLVMVDGRPVAQQSTKTDRSARTVDLGPAAVTALRSWRRTQLEHRMLVGPGWRGSEPYVFTTEVGTPLDPTAVGRRLGVLAGKAGVPRIRVHDLRHTHATHMLAAGVNPKVVSERLGHASVAFTLDTYAHVLPTQQADAAAAAERLVLG